MWFSASSRGVSARFVPWGWVVVLLALAGCGRTTALGDPCAGGRCPCIFNEDCPTDFICVDNVCVDRDAFVECVANGIQPESCNGQDDDCDGIVDEGLVERPCERTADGRTCVGVEVCSGAAGYLCDAPVPSDEICDQLDNDCNGIVDDPFVDVNGRYTLNEHCGGCGVACDALVVDALETACAEGPDGLACEATVCPPGTFVNEAGSACVGLPDALCRPCQTDDDCLGPGSQCLTFDSDERGCGRDCGANSPYGTTCPAGYECVAAQCRPQINTCLCGPDAEGTTRSCRIDTCDGFQMCEVAGGRFEWGACDISAWRETCDGLDNDCDGEIDNGFLNSATGRYESDLHCGQCNNDCTRRWTVEIDHAIGGCDLSAERPECRISACTTESIGGIDFEWVDVNGDADDGCECRRRLGNTTQDDPDLGTFAQLTQGTLDENCDGIDGVIGDALFVSENAAGGGDGSLARPFRRIGEAVAAWPTAGRRYVLVAEGVYRERLVLPDGIQIYGGYTGDFRRRDVLQLATIVQSPNAPGNGSPGTVVATDIGRGAARTIVAGLHIYGADASGAASTGVAGAASTAVILRNAGPGLTVQNNVIRGGRGAEGGRGATGQTGFGRQASTATDGRNGADGNRVIGVCSANTAVAGGAGGTNAQCGAAGRQGAGSTCPSFDWLSNPVRGTQASFTSPTADGDGPGGFHWSFDDLSGRRCGHVTESGFPSDFQSHNGGAGRDGADGQLGVDGEGCAAVFGSFTAGDWISGTAGAGTGGNNGRPGAGGGAGGGTARFAQGFDFCDAHEIGATGGGGGAGGCGGDGGLAGGSGGASIAVLVVNDLPATAPIVRDNRIERGPGGRGGEGGFGGPGGQGGRGGFGGGPNSWSGSTGGKGGDGGNGGRGGGGGGGCGGPSLGVLLFQADVDVTSNAFTVPDNASVGGAGGAGGTGTSRGEGADGGSVNVLAFEPCGPGGQCPAGQACDVNQICQP